MPDIESRPTASDASSSPLSAATPGAGHGLQAGDTSRPAGEPSGEVADLVERLASHRTVAAAPRQELTWLATHGHLRHLPAGDMVASPSRPVDAMFVLLSGSLAIHVTRGGVRHKIAEWHAGDVTGVLPYSRLQAPPGDTMAAEPSDVLLVMREDMPAMIRDCHDLTSILVHVMLDRARFFTSTALHDEKLKSIGKLAAGLAHELNNPAAAIRRSAQMLPSGLSAVEAAARVIGSVGLTQAEQAAVDRLRNECATTTPDRVQSPLEEAEREDTMSGWLETQGVDPAAAEALAQTPLALEALKRLAGSVRTDVLEPVLRWIAADCAMRELAGEIEESATRISDLVTAVRGFTRVDAASAPEAVDVGEGLVQTLAVLRGKARGLSVGMAVTVQDGLPRVRGVAAELNQVWANLIDNALDAAPASGRVDIVAERVKSSVVVRVIDNGPGIPPDIRDRIFDPFFTTKDVGKGTGLGLDIVHRLVTRHDGDIAVESRPGHTEFIVSLPAADPDSREGDA